MKIRKSSRITAIVLALMMIVPLISVPAFAEDAATPLFTQNFDVEKVTDAIKQQGAGNASGSIKDIGGEHGKVFMYDLSNGPANYYENDGEGLLYLIVNRDGAGKRIKLVKDELTFNANGTVTGYATIDGTEYKFDKAVLNEEYFTTQTTLYSIILTESYLFTTEGDFVYEEDLATAEYFLDEDDKQVKAADLVSGAVKYKMDDEGCLIAIYETKADEYATKYYLVTPGCLNAICGTTNIGQPSYVKAESNLDGTEFTLSADYYVSQDWNTSMDIRLKGTNADGKGDNFEIAQITILKENQSNVKVQCHPDIAKEATYTTGVQVAKETWFNLTLYANATTKSYEIYVNGKLAAAGTDSTSTVFDKLELAANAGNYGWALGQANRGSNAKIAYAGYYMVDNLAIYAGKVIPEETHIPAYINSMNFTGGQTYDKFGTGRQWDFDHSEFGGTAFKIDSDTYQDGKAHPNLANIIDKNLYQGTEAPAVAADENGKIVVLEADYFLVPGQLVRFEAQIMKTTSSSAAGNAAWVNLWFAETKGDRAYFCSFQGKALDGTSNVTPINSDIPTGKWITISNVIDLETGVCKTYVDGLLAIEQRLFKGGLLENFTINENNGFIAAKLSKISGTNPTSSSWPNGYTDYVLIDNVETYKDLSLLKISDEGFFTKDFDTYRYSVGAKAVSNNGTVTLSGPATATYAYTPDGELALKLDLIPADAGKTIDVPFFGGINSRGYRVPVEVESFDPEAGMEVNFPKLTRTGAGNNPNGNDKQIYYARVGTTVYVYQTADNKNGVADETGSNLVYKGTFQVVPETEPGSGLYDLKYMECFVGGSNIDKMFKTYHPQYKYNAAEGANNTYVFSAEYFVTEDASAKVEAQFYNGYLDLYVLNLDSKTFSPRLGEDPVADLVVNAWNKVEMIVTFVEKDVLIDVYLNGVYTHSTTYSAKKANVNTITANDWIICKVGKVASLTNIAALNGSVYVGEVAVQPLNADKMQTVAFDNDVLTAIVDGVEVVLPNTQGKFYATEVVAGQTFDATTVGADLFDTQDVASIRLKGPSGLRFVTKIDLDVLAAIEESFEVVEYGTAIKPVDYDGECLYVPAYRDVFFEGYKDDANYFAGSIVNIKESNMDRDFVGTAYAKIKLTNGAIVYVWAETAKVISVADQAVKTLAETDNSLYTAEELEVLNGFAAYAN